MFFPRNLKAVNPLKNNFCFVSGQTGPTILNKLDDKSRDKGPVKIASSTAAFQKRQQLQNIVMNMAAINQMLIIAGATIASLDFGTF